ncbi:MAG: ATP-binding protein [Paludibacteraceae bacterium]|nr:ATP-binding protein [Paludibacteraceae bacterium]
MDTLPFDIKKARQMIIFIGIQASGKTTFFRNVLAEQGYVHINLDTLHTRHKEQNAINECLGVGSSFVVDNTNPTKAERIRYIAEAKQHNYEVIGLFFQSILKDCIARNEARANKVPRIAIPGTQNRLEMPDYTEGFDRLYYVQIAENDFVITDWKG